MDELCFCLKIKIMHRSKLKLTVFTKWILITLALSLLIFLNEDNFKLSTLLMKIPRFFGLSFVVALARVLAEDLLLFFSWKRGNKIKSNQHHHF